MCRAPRMRDDHLVSDNTALVLILCVMSVTIGGAVLAAIRGAVEIVRVIKGQDASPTRVIR